MHLNDVIHNGDFPLLFNLHKVSSVSGIIKDKMKKQYFDF